MTAVLESSVIPAQPNDTARSVVAVVANHDLFDGALVTLVASLGFETALIDLDTSASTGTSVQPLAAAIVRTAQQIPQLRSRPHLRQAAIVAIGDIEIEPGQPHPDFTVSQRCSQAELATVLSGLAPLADRGAAPIPPVHVTDRELEVLTTYVLGATVNRTARTHFVSASTVRSHYRRVAERYNAVGRRVDNKTQLLLALISDNLISPAQPAHVTPPASNIPTLARPHGLPGIDIGNRRQYLRQIGI